MKKFVKKSDALQEGYRMGLMQVAHLITEALENAKASEETGVEINGVFIEKPVYEHLGDEHNDPTRVLQDLDSANIFDMMTDKEEIVEWISQMKFFPTLEDVNEAYGFNYTEDDVQDGTATHVISLSSMDGYVVA